MSISRRGLLLGGAAGLGVALAGCAASEQQAPTPPPPPATRPIPGMDGVQARTGRRIGVHAADLAGGVPVGHRDGERFLMCSTVKALLAGFVLHRSLGDPPLLDRRVAYGPGDLVDNSPVTSANVAAGMTVAALCEAMLTVSDNAAANLLARATGGAATLTGYLRSLDDDVTRADRTEPALNTPAGDEDTSTPAAFAATLARLTTGDALPAPQRDRLLGWMRASTTGARAIRAGVPAGWAVADKTGSGAAQERNDVALLVPPGRAPVVLTVFTTPVGPGAGTGDDAVAEATRVALGALGR